MSLNQTDLSVRLQLLGCKYSELANTYADNLKYGQKCANSNLKNLLLLNSLIEILECYTIPYYIDNILIDRNCFTSEQIESLLDKISKLINQQFQPLGFEYED